MAKLIIWVYILFQYCFTVAVADIQPDGFGGTVLTGDHANAAIDNAVNPICYGDKCVLNQYGHWETNPIDHAMAHQSPKAAEKIAASTAAHAANAAANFNSGLPYNTPAFHLPRRYRSRSRRRSRYGPYGGYRNPFPYQYNPPQYPYVNPTHPYSHIPTAAYTPQFPYTHLQFPNTQLQFPQTHLQFPQTHLQFPYTSQFPLSSFPSSYPYNSYPYSNYPYSSYHPSYMPRAAAVTGKRTGDVTMIDSMGNAHQTGHTLLAPVVPDSIAVDPAVPQPPTQFTFHNFHHPNGRIFRRK